MDVEILKVAKLMGNSGKTWSVFFLQKRIRAGGYWFSWRICSTKKGRIEESRRIFLKACVQEFLSSFFTWRNLRLFGALIWSNGPEFHVCKGAFVSTIFYHHSWNKVWNGLELSNAANHINPISFPSMASDKKMMLQIHMPQADLMEIVERKHTVPFSVPLFPKFPSFSVGFFQGVIQHLCFLQVSRIFLSISVVFCFPNMMLSNRPRHIKTGECRHGNQGHLMVPQVECLGAWCYMTW